MGVSEYRVNLEVYNGPLDLLLYLIRREEVDIHDIPIARITEQYLQYVEVLHGLDPNLAGEFLVMAATLMEIKTRMLLPSPTAEDAGEEGLDVDPREDLVRQLLQYKAFKDAADDLQEAADRQGMKFARKPPDMDFDDQGDLELEDVQVWDLFDAFRNLMESIGQGRTDHEVIYDDTPLELHQEDILDRLQREGGMYFRTLFEGRNSRGEVIGLFLALLELTRLRKIVVVQSALFSDIRLELRPEADESQDSPQEEDAEDAPTVAEGTAAEADRNETQDDQTDQALDQEPSAVEPQEPRHDPQPEA